MGIAIVWQPGPEGRAELWLTGAGGPHMQVLALEASEGREIVERWAAQAESVPEFLEMLHLEGLIDLERYHAVARQHDPLYAAACAMLECLPHRRVGAQVEDPTRELYPLIERMAQALEPFLSDTIARAIIADALGTYWASWVGCYEYLDHEVNAARQALNAVMTGAGEGVLILRPGDLTLTPEAVRVMIEYVVDSRRHEEA
ncbi:MAG TPA: hypothetical protein VLK82_18500 [Candidatus Tectomicrobia bacterium]|nr:hypothetical protein [Candidatus Tectomicrobia bacterium]